MYKNMNLDVMRRKFYQYINFFKDFDGITPEMIENIKEDAKSFKEKYLDEYLNKGDILTAYKKAMSILVNNHRLSFDEKTLYIIFIFDPNLITFKDFIASDIITKKEIKQETNELVKEAMILERESQTDTYMMNVRKQIGFFENDLLKLEKTYFKKFLKDNELIKSVGKDCSSTLVELTTIMNSFKNIDEKKYQELKNKAEEYLRLFPTPDFNTVIYHILNQNNILNLKSIKEQLIFLIMVMDPELKALEIYEEECIWSSIKERCEEEINFYHKDVFKLEKLYAEAFEPDRKFGF